MSHKKMFYKIIKNAIRIAQDIVIQTIVLLFLQKIMSS